MANPVISKQPSAAEITEIKKNPASVKGGKAIAGFARIQHAGEDPINFYILEDGTVPERQGADRSLENAERRDILMWAFAAAFLGALFFNSNRGRTVVSDVFGPPIEAFTVGNKDIDILARTIWGEARSEGLAGMQAVANVVMNRYEQTRTDKGKARRWGSTVREICLKPYQFSAWNKNDPNRPLMLKISVSDPSFRLALGIAENAVLGRLNDVTAGSDHYHTVAIRPDWSAGKTAAAVIGTHKFYNNIA